jgi:methyl coenzyme M reductase gamma subunit
MKEQLVRSLLAHAHGEINYHKANVDVYLNNPVGIGEHPDVMGAITTELERIAYYEDQVQVIEKYFK